MAKCPCLSDLDFDVCCGPFLSGKEQPGTALALMRSRYTAFTRAEIDYIKSTHDPETRDEFSEDDTREWATNAEWLGFEVLKTEAGGPEDDTGIVEFVAHYQLQGNGIDHHEISQFRKLDQRWYFSDGIEVPATVKRSEAKVGRNDPCPCGSGKKYKKCCFAKG